MNMVHVNSGVKSSLFEEDQCSVISCVILNHHNLLQIHDEWKLMHNEINLPTYQIMCLQTTEIWISVYDTTNFNDPTVYICESHQL